MSRIRRERILQIVLTDSSFQPKTIRGERVWVGRCIHCNRKLMVATTGECLGPLTIEHILPRNHGGTDEVTNLALACKRCNNTKGYRLDPLPLSNPRLIRAIEALRSARQRRWRNAADAPDPLDIRHKFGL